MRGDLRSPSDSSVGEWIARELRGDVGSVTNVVPDRFKAYARILHPATKPDGTAISWSDVAAATGRVMHARVQWYVLVGSYDPEGMEGSRWSGGAPDRGDLSPEVLRPLCTLLAKYTTSPVDCFFGLWTGWTWRSTQAFRQSVRVWPRREETVYSVEEIDGPRIELPPQAGREYVLVSGPLSAATEIGETAKGIQLSPTSPNLMWPADRSWFLASDIDLDSTLVGGSTELVEAIVNADEFEAWPIGRRDSLAVDA